MTISMIALLLSVGALMFNVGFYMGKYVGEQACIEKALKEVKQNNKITN